MKRFRRTVKKFERWFMLGLVILLLVIFTVIDVIVPGMQGSADDRRAEDVAGTFHILAGVPVDVTWEAYENARRRYWVATTVGRRDEQRVSDVEVWTFLVLLEAARRERVEVSNEDLVAELRRVWPPDYFEDKPRYKEIVRNMYGVSAAVYEECFRDLLKTARLRELYRQSFDFAPAASREEVIGRFTARGEETVRVTYAALEASTALEEARAALAAGGPEAEKELRAFFVDDPSVRNEYVKFRNPRRYAFESIYTMHGRMVEEGDWKRVEETFQRAYPQLKVAEVLESYSRKEFDDYFTQYRERLLEQQGKKWETMLAERKAKAPEEGAKPPAEGAKPPEEGEKPPQEGEKPPEEGEEPAGAGDKPSDPAREAAEAERLKKLEAEVLEDARQLVFPQATNELKLRGMYLYLRDEAAKDPKKPLREIFERLRAHDDPADPVCSEEAGKGILVYREFKEPLSAEQLQELTDGDVKFTLNFSNDITGENYDTLPVVGGMADTFGPLGHGRHMFRVTGYWKESPKTFEELTPAERDALVKDFFLPVKARARAKERLERFRAQFAEGGLSTTAFAEEARKAGFRVREDEWIEPSTVFRAEPTKALYWPEHYLRMRDRHFLRRELDLPLKRDRTENKLEPGSFFDVLVHGRAGGEDPGTAFLVLLLERKPLTGAEMPEEEFKATALGIQSSLRRDEEDWWDKDFGRLRTRFDMRFSESMLARIDQELKERSSAP